MTGSADALPDDVETLKAMLLAVLQGGGNLFFQLVNARYEGAPQGL